MSTSFEHEADKDPDLLEREINAKREHISDLVDALEQRLSPGQLMDQVLAYGKGNGGEFFHNLGTTLKNNPLPATLTAVGMAWLAMNQNRPFSPGPAHTGPGLGISWARLSVRSKARSDTLAMPSTMPSIPCKPRHMICAIRSVVQPPASATRRIRWAIKPPLLRTSSTIYSRSNRW